MHISGSAFLTTLSLAVLAASAPTERNNYGAYYARANVIGNGIEAHIQFWGNPGSPTKVQVHVVKGLFDQNTSLQGPFPYHVHTNPVGKERNCKAALGHLDPLNVTDALICDPAFPQYCQEGDLSGKHGKLNGTSTGSIDPFSYEDEYLRWYPQNNSILGRSVVIHTANLTYVACGDIISTLDGTASSDGRPTYSRSKYITKYPGPPPPVPPQIVAPFVGESWPDNDTIRNLPIPLPNPSISLKESPNVKLTLQTQNVWFNGTEVQTERPVEHPSSDPAPFDGSTDGSSWPWVA